MDCQSGEAGSNTVCGDDSSIHQSMSCSSLHVATFSLLCTSMPSFQPLVQLTILCTCPIMHDKLITYCCLHY